MMTTWILSLEKSNEGVDHLVSAKKVFRDDVVLHVRLCSWHKVMLYHQVR